MSDQEIHKGGCLCGAVTYCATGKLRPLINCHCRQCARWTGHSVTATAAKIENLRIDGDKNLSWYSSSDWAERGFCKVCGSNLFWRMPKSGRISIMAGTLAPPTGLKVAAHVFVEDISDYDVIGDDARHVFKHELAKLDSIIGED